MCNITIKYNILHELKTLGFIYIKKINRYLTIYLFACSLLFITTLSCKQPNDTKWQFAPDMADSPVFKSQSSIIDPPEHSMAMDDVIYADDEYDAQKIQNPFNQLPENKLNYLTNQGKQLYLTFCQHCHGLKAQGNGTIIDVYPRPPDLTDDMYKKRKDGFFFHKITFGGAMMPALGGSLDVNERFKIVLYLRELQNKKHDLQSEDYDSDNNTKSQTDENNDSDQ